MFDTATRDAVAVMAARLKVEPAALLAVAEIESAGKLFATVNGKQEPLIRWEGHYFDRRLKNGVQARARAAGLDSPKVGGVRNPAGQEARWNRLFLRASRIDAHAAFRECVGSAR